ncbi:MAG TPA: PilX N-terminal domain-containing pilus assembly protein [Burkholderiales bacterium]
MNHNHLAGLLACRRERGVTLVIALIFMVALTLLGVGMVRSTTADERMGANTRDYDVAFAAAEAAMRDAEIRIDGTYLAPKALLGVQNYPTSTMSCGNATSGTTGQIGICLSDTNNTPLVKPLGTAYDLEDTTHAAVIGTLTGTATLPGVAAQPRYYIESIQVATSTGSTPTGYRITSKGYGARSSTQVILQEVYLQQQ